MKITGDAARYDHRAGNDDYKQPGDLYRLMTADRQERLVRNIAGSMKGVPGRIVSLQLSHFAKADPEYGRRVDEANRRGGVGTGKVDHLRYVRQVSLRRAKILY
jgi:catalase